MSAHQDQAEEQTQTQEQNNITVPSFNFNPYTRGNLAFEVWEEYMQTARAQGPENMTCPEFMVEDLMRKGMCKTMEEVLAVWDVAQKRMQEQIDNEQLVDRMKEGMADEEWAEVKEILQRFLESGAVIHALRVWRIESARDAEAEAEAEAVADTAETGVNVADAETEIQHAPTENIGKV